MSACGNFGLVGGSEGKVTMWNLQSGLERKSFVVPTPESGSSRIGGRGVTGIVTDPLNRSVVVGTMDGVLTVIIILPFLFSSISFFCSFSFADHLLGRRV